MKVICYGDSNTWGFDPRSYFGGRYDPDSRWVDILAKKTGWNLVNEGENGREVSPWPLSIPENTDLLILLLGTNDLLQGTPTAQILRNMTAFLERLPLEASRILLLAPPALKPGGWVPVDVSEASASLARGYEALAVKLGISYADTGSWNIPLAWDGVHFSEEGHRLFARKLHAVLMAAHPQNTA